MMFKSVLNLAYLTALGQISRERLKRGSRNFARLPRTVSLTNLQKMTSLAASRQLQIEI